MALKSLLLLVALASSAIAQSTTTNMPEPSSTMVMPSTQTPMETPGPLFVNVSAEEIRRDHFFCLGTGLTRSSYSTTPDDTANRWGLWIQYPVLSYLDTMRKRHLFYVISRMINRNSVIVDDLFNRICIAEVEQYGVSTYRESVFVKLYVNGSTSLDTIRDINNAFRTTYANDNSYVVSFLGRRAIDVTATEPSMGPRLSERTVNDSVHPGCDSESCPEGDPTLLAVVIGTYVGPGYYGTDNPPEEVTVETLERLERGESISGLDGTYTPLERFADNPRPINYGLEAGDIVFAVFGSIFLTILAGAIILGYVIHPFFLA